MLYVSFDIKGIQQFIFSVPRLKCMIGASGQIAEFDTIADGVGAHASTKIQKIFAGGGRGVYQCPDQMTADTLAEGLRLEAHKLGFDLRIGIAPGFADAIQNGDRLYSFFPRRLTGFPCAESGLWPTGSDQEKIHPLIRRRINEGTRDYLGQKILRALEGRLPQQFAKFTLQFFKNVDVEPVDESEYELRTDEKYARAAQRALGERNRWAVVAMDGNDIGRQFRRLDEEFESNRNEGEYLRRVEIASKRLREITEQSFLSALVDTLEYWLSDRNQGEIEQLIHSCCVDDQRETCLILPFRPLIVGGDDVILLCHCSLAIPFVRAMSRHFTELSKIEGTTTWPETDRLTMSAGILFTGSSLPLHIAIPYAEKLLGSAKGAFRATKRGELSPAAIDWDHVTDSMIDTPSARRNRDCRFVDCELNQEVRLTRRPYLLDDDEPEDAARYEHSLTRLLGDVDSFRDFPRSFLAKLPLVLRRPWSDRVQFYASIAKNERYRDLADRLDESCNGADNGRSWRIISADKNKELGIPIRHTSMLDAISLLEEDERMQWRTVKTDSIPLAAR